MRKTSFLTLAGMFVLSASLARAQQLDLAAGGSTLFASGLNNSSIAFLPPPERGGTLVGASAQYIFGKHLGFNAEVSTRYHKGLYNDYQPFRPVFYDFNAAYAAPLRHKLSADLMGGFGGETLIFYSQLGNCGAVGGCRSYVNDTHALLHAGVSLRYYLWHDVFVRPEAHYYYIDDNFEFHSNNLLRVGASIGVTFGSH